MTPRTKEDAYLIRFPDGMRDELKSEAVHQGRTLASHIVYLLTTHPERKRKGAKAKK